MRSQIAHVDPRQHEIPGVIRKQVEVAPTRLGRPSDEAVAWSQVARRRAPRETGDRSARCEAQEFQVLADGLLIPQVVILREQPVEESFVGGPPDLVHEDRAQLPQRRDQGTRVEQHGGRARAWPPGFLGRPLGRRQDEVARPMQPQQQAATHDIARRPVRLRPLPCLAHAKRQGPPTQGRLRRDQRAEERHVGGRDHAAPIGEWLLHARQRTRLARRTQAAPRPRRSPRHAHPPPHRRRVRGGRIARHDQPLQLMRLQGGGFTGALRPPAKPPAGQSLVTPP